MATPKASRGLLKLIFWAAEYASLQSSSQVMVEGFDRSISETIVLL